MKTKFRFLFFIGFPGYAVSSDGIVWSRWQQIYLGRGKGSRRVLRSSQWKRLKIETIKGGYKMVSLLKGKRRYRYLVHRLILEAFVGPCPEGMEACHFPDRNRGNNDLNNLRWDTKKNNMKDREYHGRTYRGSKHVRSKLTEQKVLRIRKLHSPMYSYSKLAKMFHVSKKQIGVIIRRKVWKHI